MTLIKGLKDEEQLVASIGNVYPTEDWDDDKLKSFLYELIKLGINTADAFNSRYTYTTDDHRPYQDFVWYYYWDLKDMGDELVALHGLCIDYVRTWEWFLSHRYQCFRFDGEVHFYRMSYLDEH